MKNKYQEALDKLHKRATDYNLANTILDDKQLTSTLQELVDKATPVKPREKRVGRGIHKLTHYYCPKCDCKTTLIPQEFCLKCGQKLDWSDE